MVSNGLATNWLVAVLSEWAAETLSLARSLTFSHFARLETTTTTNRNLFHEWQSRRSPKVGRHSSARNHLLDTRIVSGWPDCRAILSKRPLLGVEWRRLWRLRRAGSSLRHLCLGSGSFARELIASRQGEKVEKNAAHLFFVLRNNTSKRII